MVALSGRRELGLSFLPRAGRTVAVILRISSCPCVPVPAGPEPRLCHGGGDSLQTWHTQAGTPCERVWVDLPPGWCVCAECERGCLGGLWVCDSV